MISFGHIIILIVFTILITIIMLSFKANRILSTKYNTLVVKHKVRIRKLEKEVHTKNKFVKEQLEEIMAQNLEITESIIYARKIQKAILPPLALFEKNFKEYFILFKPKQIVSGDFYWCIEKNNKIYLTAADCTGHGVPGAFMSMLGISFLNEITNQNEILHANEILNKLRNLIVSSLRQTGKDGSSKDGMDMSLCVIDKEKSELEYAGAYNPLILIRKKEFLTIEIPENPKIKVEETDNHQLILVKPDRMPVGFDYRNEGHSFSNLVLNYQKEDTIYLFSDGYADQFGGERNKKYSISRFKKLLLNIQDLDLEEQNERLDEEHEKWQGQYSQIDDILIMGFKF